MGKDDTVHFLLVYSFDQAKLVHQGEFLDRHAAIRAYDAAERAYRHLDKFEIVLIGADSIQTVMQTHGHYFASSDDSMFSDFLADA
ncbi:MULTISPECIES: hypothetical protein [Rhodococcus]|uniref:hypothetical protein n=1 Tax=Rhodococcus TaxID=1827 RepID=UPI001ABF1C37|nr:MULTISPECIES: hypothetical protein [Rhodococcus]